MFCMLFSKKGLSYFVINDIVIFLNDFIVDSCKKIRVFIFGIITSIFYYTSYDHHKKIEKTISNFANCISYM